MENKRFTIFIPVLLAITLVTGILIGNLLKRNSLSPLAGMQFASTNKISTILDLVQSGYVDSVNISDIVEKAIPEILKNFDPHTIYIPAKNMQEEQEKMSGNFSGIGVLFSIQEDTVRVIEVISGGPSQKVGLLAGDRIVTVNDSVIAGINIKNQKVLDLLRGKKGSIVKVGVMRTGSPELLEFEITRGDIPIYSVDVSYMVNKETGYIKVSRFAEHTYREFMEGMDKLDKQGARKVIIDLRGNTGGYLTAVIRMVDEFLKKGELILYTEGFNQPRKTYTSSAHNTFADKDVIVLIDEYSASASEIFAGALQDNDRAIIVGRRSFGKGLVQEQIPLFDGSALRLTVARYYTPSGRCIQKPYDKGVDQYSQDLIERIHHGEMEESDSIHFKESLKYHTKSGRVVYGGGGIMPDIFVPADTTGISEYFIKLTQKGIIYQYAYAYADRERETLNKLANADEFNSYLDKQDIFNGLIRYAVKKGLPRDPAGFKESELVIKTQLKASIARNIIGEEGYFPIIKQIDTTLLKAIEVSKQNLVVEEVGLRR